MELVTNREQAVGFLKACALFTCWGDERERTINPESACGDMLDEYFSMEQGDIFMAGVQELVEEYTLEGGENPNYKAFVEDCKTHDVPEEWVPPFEEWARYAGGEVTTLAAWVEQLEDYTNDLRECMYNSGGETNECK